MTLENKERLSLNTQISSQDIRTGINPELIPWTILNNFYY